MTTVRHAASSGFVDDVSGCPITQESYDDIREFESGPKPRLFFWVTILQ